MHNMSALAEHGNDILFRLGATEYNVNWMEYNHYEAYVEQITTAHF